MNKCNVNGIFPKCFDRTGENCHFRGKGVLDLHECIYYVKQADRCTSIEAIRAAIAAESACCGSCEAYKETHPGSGSYGCDIHDWCYAPWNVCKRYKPRTSRKVEPIEDEEDEEDEL
jgi:hypothetical protein